MGSWREAYIDNKDSDPQQSFSQDEMRRMNAWAEKQQDERIRKDIAYRKALVQGLTFPHVVEKAKIQINDEKYSKCLTDIVLALHVMEYVFATSNQTPVLYIGGFPYYLFYDKKSQDVISFLPTTRIDDALAMIDHLVEQKYIQSCSLTKKSTDWQCSIKCNGKTYKGLDKETQLSICKAVVDILNKKSNRK